MKTSTFLSLLPLAMAAPGDRASPAPILVPRGLRTIEGKYIVKLKDGSSIQTVNAAISSINSHAKHTYTQSFHGFSASLSPSDLEKLRNNPNVDFIEQDATVTISNIERSAPWGLARISSKKIGATTYTYDRSAGSGTCAFVIDTGVDIRHPEFEGRATLLKNFVDDNIETDNNGHGTHVCGTVGSNKYGVAKKTKIFGVKVLDSDGYGSNSDVIAGMDFVAKEAKNQYCPKGRVVNMSLGGAKSAAINLAAVGITKAGLFLAVAAGNDGDDASFYSPASEESACTVGATTKNDTLASYSNFGPMVDILAPGTDILSTWINGETNTISGTSMATPHVTGIAAYFLGKGRSISGLCAYIVQSGEKNVIHNVPANTRNVIINNLA